MLSVTTLAVGVTDRGEPDAVRTRRPSGSRWSAQEAVPFFPRRGRTA